MCVRLSLLLPPVCLLLGACNTTKPDAKPDTVVQASGASLDPLPDPGPPYGPDALGGLTSVACGDAMLNLAKLDTYLLAGATWTTADVKAQWTGPLEAWTRAAGTALDRDDAAVITASLTRLDGLTDPDARQRELVVLVTRLRTVGLLEMRRLLTTASDADPAFVAKPTRAAEWDDAWCVWNQALRPLTHRADALPTHGGEDWEQTIADAFASGHAGLDDPDDPTDPADSTAAKVSRQVIEKGSYAVAYRLILADAEAKTALASAEALGLLDLLEDRLADRNGPGLARMRTMLGGDPSAVDPAAIERELAVAFTKRARKYCDKAVVKAELGQASAIAETWEGIVYTKVILPSMREALAPGGFDADAYSADWTSYLEAVETNDADTAAAISARLVEWNCTYQDHLGIAECGAV